MGESRSKVETEFPMKVLDSEMSKITRHEIVMSLVDDLDLLGPQEQQLVRETWTKIQEDAGYSVPEAAMDAIRAAFDSLNAHYTSRR